jgi:hypothetical protein
VRRHLASARTRIGCGADRLEQHRERRQTQRQGEGAVAIIRVKPVVAGLQNETRGHLDGFVTRPADLKKDPVLPLQEYFPVIQQARGLHQTESVDQGFRFEAEKARRLEPLGAGRRGE